MMIFKCLELLLKSFKLILEDGHHLVFKKVLEAPIKVDVLYTQTKAYGQWVAEGIVSFYCK